MTQTLEHCDVVVIGGGPAGSATATFLARSGWRTVLLEKDRHPRFHIGESLLPFSMPVIERLGVASEVARIGRKKPGAEFISSRLARRQHYDFIEALDNRYPHAYQVRRAEFDRILFDNATASGATARQGHRVAEVDWTSEAVELTVVPPDEAPYRIRAAQVVDATGRDTLLSRQFGSKRRNPDHASAAMYAHFEGVPLGDGDRQGNIKIFWFEHGWLWFIPFRDGTVSVGAVCSPDYLKTRRTELNAFLADAIERCPELHALLADARRIRDTVATGNYSYQATALTGHRWAMVGDAYAFVDPVFSSGVHLALTGAETVSALVDARLRGRHAAARRMERHYRRRTIRKIRRFSWFIYRITDPVMERLFVRPSDRFRMRRAVVSLLAGDIHGNPRMWLPLFVFRVVYGSMRLVNRYSRRTVVGARAAN